MKSLSVLTVLLTDMSLPSRKCGLKSFAGGGRGFCVVSLPSRKCGLKSVLYSVVLPTRASLPSRKCGLKCSQINKRDVTVRVTSFAEVWIEILMWVIVPLPPRVTSFAEVWIEILQGVTRPYQGCVTSFAEVWIEICAGKTAGTATVSLPSRKCGLKSGQEVRMRLPYSHFLRGSVD